MSTHKVLNIIYFANDTITFGTTEWAENILDILLVWKELIFYIYKHRLGGQYYTDNVS